MTWPMPYFAQSMEQVYRKQMQARFEAAWFPCCPHCNVDIEPHADGGHPIRCMPCIGELCDDYCSTITPEDKATGYSLRVLMALWLDEIDKRVLG